MYSPDFYSCCMIYLVILWCSQLRLPYASQISTSFPEAKKESTQLFLSVSCQNKLDCPNSMIDHRSRRKAICQSKRIPARPAFCKFALPLLPESPNTSGHDAPRSKKKLLLIDFGSSASKSRHVRHKRSELEPNEAAKFCIG